MKLKQSQGFTLIELMIALVILGVITAIAYPSYTSHMTNNRRAQGQVALMDISQRMERYYAENHTFVGATLATIGSNNTAGDGSNTSYYNLALSNLSATGFTASATATGTQASNDISCGIVAMNQLGQKGRLGNGVFQVDANCW